MARINLLPWREQRREQLRQEFLVILGSVVGFGIAVIVLAHLFTNGQIEHQNARNDYLRREIAELDKKVIEIKDLQTRRAQLIDRMKVIQDLQGTRPVIVRIFDELARTLPDGVHFRALSRKDGLITIQGTAESNNRVSSLMRRLDASEWFANPVLKGVKANPAFGEQANDFDMTVSVSMPVADANADQGQSGE